MAKNQGVAVFVYTITVQERARIREGAGSGSAQVEARRFKVYKEGTVEGRQGKTPDHVMKRTLLVCLCCQVSGSSLYSSFVIFHADDPWHGWAATRAPCCANHGAQSTAAQ